MAVDLQSDRSIKISPSSVTRFHGTVSSRIGNIRAVTLEGRVMNAGPIFGLPWGIEETIKEVLSKSAHAVQLEADRQAYELKADILNVFGRTENTSS